jgi:hypothetical protein
MQATVKAKTTRKSNKLRLMALWENQGLIAYVQPDGSIGLFAQKGVHTKLTHQEKIIGISEGVLNERVMNCIEVPNGITLYHEEPSIQGKVKTVFPAERFKQQLKRLM